MHFNTVVFTFILQYIFFVFTLHMLFGQTNYRGILSRKSCSITLSIFSNTVNVFLSPVLLITWSFELDRLQSVRYLFEHNVSVLKNGCKSFSVVTLFIVNSNPLCLVGRVSIWVSEYLSSIRLDILFMWGIKLGLPVVSFEVWNMVSLTNAQRYLRIKNEIKQLC